MYVCENNAPILHCEYVVVAEDTHADKIRPLRVAYESAVASAQSAADELSQLRIALTKNRVAYDRLVELELQAKGALDAANQEAIKAGAIVRSTGGLRTGEVGVVTKMEGLGARVSFNGLGLYKDINRLELVFPADHAIAKSYVARTNTTYRTGDVVVLTSQHPLYKSYADNRYVLGEKIDWGFRFNPSHCTFILSSLAGNRYATVVTPVELRADIDEVTKLALLGVTLD